MSLDGWSNGNHCNAYLTAVSSCVSLRLILTAVRHGPHLSHPCSCCCPDHSPQDILMSHGGGSVDAIPSSPVFRNIWSNRTWAKPKPGKPCLLTGGCWEFGAGIDVGWGVSDGVTRCWGGVRIRALPLPSPPGAPGTVKGVEWSPKKLALTSAYALMGINVMKQKALTLLLLTYAT